MARPRPAGRSLEARGNAGPREMVATVFDGTEPGVQTGSSVLASLLSTHSLSWAPCSQTIPSVPRDPQCPAYS